MMKRASGKGKLRLVVVALVVGVIVLALFASNLASFMFAHYSGGGGGWFCFCNHTSYNSYSISNGQFQTGSLGLRYGIAGLDVWNAQNFQGSETIRNSQSATFSWWGGLVSESNSLSMSNNFNNAQYAAQYSPYAYPSIAYGCLSWGAPCSNTIGSLNFPMQLSSFRSTSTTSTITYNINSNGVQYDLLYDLWIEPNSNCGNSPCSNGVEIGIALIQSPSSYGNGCFGFGNTVQSINIDGNSENIAWHITGGCGSAHRLEVAPEVSVPPSGTVSVPIAALVDAACRTVSWCNNSFYVQGITIGTEYGINGQSSLSGFSWTISSFVVQNGGTSVQVV
ncbi:MAG: GH12 family glycosyl hydrolase domain-containing protein [Nitrososphaerales archaeon]